MADIIVIAHNIRSCHNVGSLLRTAEGMGVSMVYLTGYTPFPMGGADDRRLPHIGRKLHAQIQKTALGAELSQPWRVQSLEKTLTQLRQDGFMLAALEQAATAQALFTYQPPPKIALLLGSEVAGVSPAVLTQMDVILEIPMFGKKESFNVVQATAMALYHFRLCYTKP